MLIIKMSNHILSDNYLIDGNFNIMAFNKKLSLGRNIEKDSAKS